MNGPIVVGQRFARLFQLQTVIAASLRSGGMPLLAIRPVHNGPNWKAPRKEGPSGLRRFLRENDAIALKEEPQCELHDPGITRKGRDGAPGATRNVAVGLSKENGIE